MLFGVLERLTLLEQSAARLVLRELPLLAWLFAFACLMGSFSLAWLGASATALIAPCIGLLLLLLAARRVLIFDRAAGELRVEMRAPLRRRVALRLPLSEIQAVELLQSEDGATQLALRLGDGTLLGLSVYSRDIADWKTPLLRTIAAWLQSS